MTEKIKIEQYSGLTDIGLRRSGNEDAFGTSQDIPLFIVADGVGGRNAGEVASALAVETLQSAAPELKKCILDINQARTSQATLAMRNALERSFLQAHRKIMAASTDASRSGMATTMVAAVVAGGRAYLAHVGGS